MIQFAKQKSCGKNGQKNCLQVATSEKVSEVIFSSPKFILIECHNSRM